MRGSRHQNRYDHRLRELVHETGDVDLAVGLGVPRSTANGWVRHAPPEVVTLDVFEMDGARLHREVVKLRRRVQILTTVVGLLVTVARALGTSLEQRRVGDDRRRRAVIRAIERGRRILPLRSVLRVIGLSSSRYHAWTTGEPACAAEDADICPRRAPNQLTASEITAMRSFAMSLEFRHVPTSRLALLAQRAGKVFASASTWYRVIRLRGWRRPRFRIYPSKPKVGLRTAGPDEAWHIDTTLIRLLDGTALYLHGVIDNFSRRILAWHLAKRMAATSTVAVLCDAIARRSAAVDEPMLVVDGGTENFNALVDEVVKSGRLRRVLAQTDIRFSNSRIEAFWRSAKNQWLYLNTLDSFATVERLVQHFVDAHNDLPLVAFGGRTSCEVHEGRAAELPDELADARAEARLRRLESNRLFRCEVCAPPNRGSPPEAAAA